MCVCLYVFMFICMYVYVYVCLYVCLYMCIYVYVYQNCQGIVGLGNWFPLHLYLLGDLSVDNRVVGW